MKASNKQKSLSLLLKSYNGFSHGFFIYFFAGMKELKWARINWKWLNVKSLGINMFQTNTRKNQ